MRILQTLFILLGSGQLFAQIAVSGQLVDGSSEEVLPFANVVLTPPDQEQIIAGETTDVNGRFLLEQVEPGTYDLRIAFMGYQDFEMEDLRLGDENEKSFGTLELQSTSVSLDEVVVREQRQSFTPSLEGLSINPEKNVAQQGGSILDILQNAPSVRVDQDGNIAIRGTSSANILINGRNSALSGNLGTIAASAEEKVEINYNPGAKYDAQGQGGLIDIQLKEGAGSGRELGLSGRASATVGNRGRYNGSLGLTQEWKKVKLFDSYDRRRDFDGDTGFTIRENTVTGEIAEQTAQEDGHEVTDNINAGVSFYPDKWNTIDFSTVVSFESEDKDEDITNKRSESSGETIRNTLRRSSELENERTIENAVA